MNISENILLLNDMFKHTEKATRGNQDL